MNNENQTISSFLKYIFCFCIAMLMMLTAALANAGGAWELGIHNSFIYGTSDLESGNMDAAIVKLKTRLPLRIHRKRAPVLTNLCVAYTMKRDFESAKKYCNEAVENGWSLGLAYSNRGVMHIAHGDIVAAHADFAAAMESYGGAFVKRHNLARCEHRMAVMAANKLNNYAILEPVQANITGDLPSDELVAASN